MAAATEGISHEEGLDAITSTSLVNQSFKQITENFSMKLLGANLQLAAQTAQDVAAMVLFYDGNVRGA